MATDGFTASVTKPSASIIIHIKADDNILENEYRTPVIFEWDDIKCKYIYFPTDYYMYTESVSHSLNIDSYSQSYSQPLVVRRVHILLDMTSDKQELSQPIKGNASPDQ